MSELNDEISKKFITEFIEFLNDACTAFHAVNAAKNKLLNAGFTELNERNVWELKTAGKYFFTRNKTTLIAFTIGGSFNPTTSGYTILGAHTDSPCLKIKPVTCVQKSDALLLNLQPYGGGLWHTWFDRDLGIAGRVIVKGDNDSIESRLVRINKPIARIPNLAIHLTSGTERDSFAPNLHEHAKAILTTNKSLINIISTNEVKLVTNRIHPLLLKIIATELNIDESKIEDAELQLIDIQPTTTGGVDDEFIFSGRLDNLCSSYQSLRALIDGSSDDIQNQSNIRMVLLFDHEEIGSSSLNGAASSIFIDTLQLINSYIFDGSTGSFLRSLRKSFLVSADMAHGVHPNYAGKHDSSMAPKINNGLVVKHNANQRYATNSVSASLFRRIGRLVDVPVQEFSVRADSGCGSTIGPILSTLSGILTVDVGTPQYSMHSIREMMGSIDAYIGYVHLKGVLTYHPKLAEGTDTS